MQCPVCDLDQLIVEFEGVELDLCIDGHGVWFDADELQQLFEVAGVPEVLHGLEQRLTVLPKGDHGARRRCPRCSRKMEHVQAPGRSGPVVLDRCPRGHGLWFDEGELEQVVAADLEGTDPGLARVKEFLARFAAPRQKEEEGC